MLGQYCGRTPADCLPINWDRTGILGDGSFQWGWWVPETGALIVLAHFHLNTSWLPSFLPPWPENKRLSVPALKARGSLVWLSLCLRIKEEKERNRTITGWEYRVVWWNGQSPVQCNGLKNCPKTLPFLGWDASILVTWKDAKELWIYH